jgi:cytochrome b6-f complex iron-sulfur subunit
VSPGTIALIVVAASIVAWAMFMANLTIRRHRKEPALAGAGSGAGTATAPEPTSEPAREAPAEKPPAKERKPLTPDQMAVSRRQFLNRAWTASFTGFLGLFGMSTLSFLWPKLTGGFGTVINAGNFDDLIKEVGPENGYKPKFVAEGRFWLVYYGGDGSAPVYELIGVSKDQPLMALYRKCVHLGCSVPHCEKSMLFECPCHGSKYRLNGEFYGGPAPRGLDRFPIEVSDGGKVMVDTGARQDGPPRGINTWQQFAGPQGGFCVPT